MADDNAQARARQSAAAVLPSAPRKRRAVEEERQPPPVEVKRLRRVERDAGGRHLGDRDVDCFKRAVGMGANDAANAAAGCAAAATAAAVAIATVSVCCRSSRTGADPFTAVARPRTQPLRDRRRGGNPRQAAGAARPRQGDQRARRKPCEQQEQRQQQPCSRVLLCARRRRGGAGAVGGGPAAVRAAVLACGSGGTARHRCRDALIYDPPSYAVCLARQDDAVDLHKNCEAICTPRKLFLCCDRLLRAIRVAKQTSTRVIIRYMCVCWLSGSHMF